MYVLTFPLVVVVLALFAGIGIIVCFVYGIYSIIRFFRGKSFFSVLPEDEKIQKIHAYNNFKEQQQDAVLENSDKLYVTSTQIYNFESTDNEGQVVSNEVKEEANPIETNTNNENTDVEEDNNDQP